MWEIFEMFDTKREGRLDKAAYQRYLRGIGAWGTDEDYTDAGWDARWPKECELLGCTAATGVTREGFKALYIKFRQTDAAADLASCHATLVSALRPTPPHASLPACASSRPPVVSPQSCRFHLMLSVYYLRLPAALVRAPCMAAEVLCAEQGPVPVSLSVCVCWVDLVR